jgi:hypothetical protein
MNSIRLTTAEYRGAYAALMILKMRLQLSIDQPDEGSWAKHSEKQCFYDSMLACKQAGLIEKFDIPNCLVWVRGVPLNFESIPSRIKPQFIAKKRTK